MRKRTFSRVPEGLTNAAFALFGVLITGLVNYISATQAAAISGKQACIARVDQRELVIRQKAESFMVALAGIAAPATHSLINKEVVEKASDELLRSAFSLSSYADEELGGLAEIVALQLSKRLDASMHKDEDPDRDKALAKDSMKSLDEWKTRYRSFMRSLQQDRERC